MDVGIWVGALLVAVAAWVLVLDVRRRRRRRRGGADVDGGHRSADAAVRGPRRGTIHWLRRLGLSGSAAGGRLGRDVFVRGWRRRDRDSGPRRDER